MATTNLPSIDAATNEQDLISKEPNIDLTEQSTHSDKQTINPEEFKQMALLLYQSVIISAVLEDFQQELPTRFDNHSDACRKAFERKATAIFERFAIGENVGGDLGGFLREKIEDRMQAAARGGLGSLGYSFVFWDDEERLDFDPIFEACEKQYKLDQANEDDGPLVCKGCDELEAAGKLRMAVVLRAGDEADA
ncbi:hypothetical protein BU16DRAFT_565060 [Lophium mytilinum]|uniref:Uncharacterized protein n=1 Tax=Lophium mytilinum TaxID=390894 RepID=A0A6A6QH31_9PEZI|nr:hypothetical protein BU16DRAFT_565060 [Lophium mytilinum]